MTGKRRGRTGRGWDAAPPPRARRSRDTQGQPPHGEPATQRESARRQEAGQGPAEPVLPRPPEVRDPAERAREICLRQLAVRPRTRAELAQVLAREGIPDEVAVEVLERYREVGMIDDAAFARAWVSSRHHSRGLATRALGQELRRRGVDSETAGEALAELDADTEVATARELVARKLRTARGEPQAVLRRLVGMLARKGYPPGVAFRVVKEALAADDRTAEVADHLDPDAWAAADDLEQEGAGPESGGFPESGAGRGPNHPA